MTAKSSQKSSALQAGFQCSDLGPGYSTHRVSHVGMPKFCLNVFLEGWKTGGVGCILQAAYPGAMILLVEGKWLGLLGFGRKGTRWSDHLVPTNLSRFQTVYGNISARFP